MPPTKKQKTTPIAASVTQNFGTGGTSSPTQPCANATTTSGAVGPQGGAVGGPPPVALMNKSSKPEWLKNLDKGNEFNTAQSVNYPHNEVYIDRPDGKGYYRVDSYSPAKGEIVSRKFTQLSDVQETTAAAYVNELAKKYPPGAKISDVPSSGTLGGKRLQGQMVLEVPVQAKPIPKSVLEAAEQKGILIRDTDGKVH